MQGEATTGRRPERGPGARLSGPISLAGVGTGVVLAGLGAVFVPALPILLGVLLVVAVAVHAASPDLRPWVDLLLRVPIARARRRHAHLAVAAAAGVLLVVGGAFGATVRGRMLGRAELRSQQREAGASRVDGLLAQARQRLASGDVSGAELVLLEADAVVGGPKGDEVRELLGRVQLCGDPAGILEILVALPDDDLAALEKGTAVPEGLELGEKALTYRAVETARAQLDEARRRRAAR